MKNNPIIITLLIASVTSCTVLPLYGQSSKGEIIAVDGRTNNSKLSAQDIVFTENYGQVSDEKGKVKSDILFTAHSGETNIYLTGTSINYQFTKITYTGDHDPNHRSLAHLGSRALLQKETVRETHRFSLVLQNSNPAPNVRREALQPYTENFYLAHCPNGITNVPTYGRIVMENVYPGIDWIIYSNKTGIEYDFLVHPNADPSQIILKIEDADKVNLTEKGELVISTSLGAVRETKPLSFCNNKTVETRFIKNDDGTLSFNLGKYDRRSALHIDPSVSWASYYGGTGLDVGYACITDPTGNIYLSGATASTSGIASSGGHQTTKGGVSTQDAFLVKFSNGGTRLWATYYGGSDDEEGFSCAADAGGNVYLSGYTISTTSIATSGSHKASYGSSLVNAFLVQFNSNGTRQWGTYFGGENMQTAFSCFVDPSSNVFLTGSTSSTTGIATAGAHQTNYGGGNNDMFLAKFNSAGLLQFSTYFGGAGDDQNCAGNVDAAGNAYVSGLTTSSSAIASPGASQSALGGSLDACLAKFSNIGARLWSTYFGGSGDETGWDVAADATGNIYMVGSTKSSGNIASTGAQQTSFGGDVDLFSIKFNTSGVRQWSTYYGGAGADWGNGCVVDASGNLYVSGQSTSTSGISSNGSQNTNGGGNDAVLVKFNTSGVRQWATYFGGPGDDRALDCALDASGNIMMAGMTSSSSAVATNAAYQTTYGGGAYDAFLTRFFPTTSSIVNVNPSTRCKVYPNPVSQQLSINLDLKANEQVGYRIINIVGHTVAEADAMKFDAGSHIIQVNANAWPSGVYFVQLMANDATISVKFVKQ